MLNRIKTANKIDYENRIEVCKTFNDNPKYSNFLITKVYNEDQELYIVRDDYLCGGTKSRLCYDFLLDKINLGYREFVYVSPWNGAASIALSSIAKLIENELGIKARITIFIEKYLLSELPPFINIGKMYGATIIQVDKKHNINNVVMDYAKKMDALVINPGFNYPEVIDTIGTMVQGIKEKYGIFDEVWCAVGSGTLIRGLQRGEIGKKYYGVCIFERCPDIGDAIPIVHYQKDFEPVDENKRAPFRSASYYDSKVYQYVKDRKGKILLWNVI